MISNSTSSPRLTFVANKPDSEDVVRGCIQERYASEFFLATELTSEETEELLVDYLGRNSRLRIGEEGYSIQILCDGKLVRDVEGLESANFIGSATEADEAEAQRITELVRSMFERSKAKVNGNTVCVP